MSNPCFVGVFISAGPSKRSKAFTIRIFLSFLLGEMYAHNVSEGKLSPPSLMAVMRKEYIIPGWMFTLYEFLLMIVPLSKAELPLRVYSM